MILRRHRAECLLPAFWRSMGLWEPRMTKLLVMLPLMILAACADSTLIRTEPPGAAIYVRKKFVCLSPCEYSAPRSEFSPHTALRIEKTGYEPIETELKSKIMPSRIVGGVFTLGIVPLFKRPYTYYFHQEYALSPITVAAAPAPPIQADQRGAEEGSVQQSRPQDVAGRLRKAQDLYDRGLISDQEYKRARNQILNDF